MDSKQTRKPNFSSAERALILQLVEENSEIIWEKFSSTITNKRKPAVWQNICEKINALGAAKRSATDIKEKWRTMRNEVRKDMSREKTGGGKAPAPVKPTNQRILSLLGDEPGFSGIQGGIESGKWLVMRKKYINYSIEIVKDWRTSEFHKLYMQNLCLASSGPHLTYRLGGGMSPQPSYWPLQSANFAPPPPPPPPVRSQELPAVGGQPAIIYQSEKMMLNISEFDHHLQAHN